MRRKAEVFEGEEPRRATTFVGRRTVELFGGRSLMPMMPEWTGEPMAVGGGAAARGNRGGGVRWRYDGGWVGGWGGAQKGAAAARMEQLQAQIERVLSRALAAAHRQVQEAKEELSGEKAWLGDLQRLLRMSQQFMVGQVTALHPVRVFHELPVAENHRPDTDTNG